MGEVFSIELLYKKLVACMGHPHPVYEERKREIFMGIGSLLKGKLLVAVLVSVTVAGGVTAVAAATPVGQSIVHTITGSKSQSETSVSVRQHEDPSNRSTPDAGNHQNTCPGLPEAQQLATKFSLNTGSTSDDILAICALHQGTFKGTTSSGTTASSSRVFGYGEIEDLLTYAQYLAAHDTANTSSKLTSDNLRGYLADALQKCGTTPLEICLKNNIPGFQPGNGNGNGNPGAHPTPVGGKPDATPTPAGGKPDATPTPNH